ncbi:hypothetical protein BGX27_001411 [Mortierella sp. AM989]|nr:hypothetical protein BGX27_001411 [Mortierella sp. AM989]
MSTQSKGDARPSVMIVGAGFSGLLLAILLEQINVPYHIYERAKELCPLGMLMPYEIPYERLLVQVTHRVLNPFPAMYDLVGSIMTMGSNMLPVFEQLGLLEEVMKLSKILKATKLYNPDMSELATQDMSFLKEALGYHCILFSRPKLYELLLSRVPTEKISLNKKVLGTKEEDGKVTIECSDNTSYEGDILIGADGAYSSVRHSL